MIATFASRFGGSIGDVGKCCWAIEKGKKDGLADIQRFTGRPEKTSKKVLESGKVSYLCNPLRR